MPGYRTGALDIGVTADQVRLLAHQVDAQIESVNVDVGAAASDPKVNWNLKLGTAWLEFYHAWKAELQQADDNSWLTFGLGPEYERIRDYQAQAKDWQAKVKSASGKASSGPAIEDTRDSGLTTNIEFGLGGVAIGAAAAVVAILLLRK